MSNLLSSFLSKNVVEKKPEEKQSESEEEKEIELVVPKPK